MAEDIEVTQHGGTGGRVTMSDVEQDAPDYPSWNPRGEETIRVRVRDNAPSFYSEGRKCTPGQEIDMTMRQAQAAGMWVVEVVGDQERPVRQPNEVAAARSVPKANVAGAARHERIGELEREQRELKERLDVVTKQLAHEREQEKPPQQEQPAKAQADTPKPTRRHAASTPDVEVTRE